MTGEVLLAGCCCMHSDCVMFALCMCALGESERACVSACVFVCVRVCVSISLRANLCFSKSILLACVSSRWPDVPVANALLAIMPLHLSVELS